MEDSIMTANSYNGLSLAYIGDAIYEIYIRKYVLSLGYTKVNDLHKHVIKYTSGEGQAYCIHKFLEMNILNENELMIFKRGRNSHVNSSRKNLELKDYLDATGFEALMGYLYLDENIQRLEELINLCIKLRGEKDEKEF
jgi:ribonuclease-3 family protein